jgi:hypothetical protein
MDTYVLRLWLPDRPGALGLVATRIGAVRGDVLSIEIIERDGGQAIDELVVALPDPELVPLMLSEIAEVDGVAVEDIWPVGAGRPTRDAQLLDLVETLVVADPDKRLQVLCDGLQTALDTDWAVALAGSPLVVQAAAGPLPDEGWLGAFLDGARFMPSTEPAPGDVGWASCDALTIAVGRARWALRSSERAHLKQLARIAAALAA